MKYTAKLMKAISLALLTSLVVIVHGCGDSETTPPDGSTITVNPESIDIISPTDSIHNISAVIRYADGTPMPYAKVHIAGSFAEPFIPAQYQFYYYPNGPENPEGNTPIDSGFYGQADEFGVFTFSIVIFGGGVFDDTIYFTAGTATEVMTITAGQ